jgi:hypothetical protein
MGRGGDKEKETEDGLFLIPNLRIENRSTPALRHTVIPISFSPSPRLPHRASVVFPSG